MAFEDEISSQYIFSSNEKFESSASNNGVFYNFCVSPTSLDLDPYWFFLKYDPNFGLVPNNDYSIVVKDNLYNTTDFNVNKDPIKQEVRILAQKTPMMVQGWGYDVCGIAVPQNSPDERFFHPNTPVNRKLWKTGPLDIRWDDERKVWVGGAEFIEGLMTTDLPAGDPDNPSFGYGQIYRSDLASVGTTWKYDKYVIAPNPDPLLAIRPDPYGSLPQNGQVGEFKELVGLYNRNSGLTLSSGDYFCATKINYEWRVVGGGGGGGGSASGNVLMLLGTYDQYKDCPGAPPIPPTGENKEPCWPTYAWASYAICGYKYVKTGDARGYGKWAWELNGGTASAMRRFYSAYYGGTAGCKGVRFLGFSSAGGLSCVCPEWIRREVCFKLTVKFKNQIPCDPDHPPSNCFCDNQFWEDMAPYWGTTVTVKLCSFADCFWAGEPGPFSANMLWSEIPIGDKTCFWGPSEFDPCDPCAGFSKFSLSINKGKASGGDPQNFYSVYRIDADAIKALVNNCATGPLTLALDHHSDGACPNAIDSVQISCCSTAEKQACVS
jgi:hypothetical protein